MSGSGAGYDQSTSTYSPDGRVFQIEYAQKAVGISGTALALCCSDGVVFATEKTLVSKMLVPESTKRVWQIDQGVSLGFAGILPDARELVDHARSEAKTYREYYDEDIPVRVLAERIAMFMHAYTQYWSVRPFGVTIFLGSWRNGNSELYTIDPSGTVTKFFGDAAGKGRQSAKNEIEKVNFMSYSTKDAILLAAKTIIKSHDDNDKDYELEIVAISAESNGKHKEIPKDVLTQIEAQARELIKNEQE